MYVTVQEATGMRTYEQPTSNSIKLNVKYLREDIANLTASTFVELVTDIPGAWC